MRFNKEFAASLCFSSFAVIIPKKRFFFCDIITLITARTGITAISTIVGTPLHYGYPTLYIINLKSFCMFKVLKIFSFLIEMAANQFHYNSNLLPFPRAAYWYPALFRMRRQSAISRPLFWSVSSTVSRGLTPVSAVIRLAPDIYP